MHFNLVRIEACHAGDLVTELRLGRGSRQSTLFRRLAGDAAGGRRSSSKSPQQPCRRAPRSPGDRSDPLLQRLVERVPRVEDLFERDDADALGALRRAASSARSAALPRAQCRATKPCGSTSSPTAETAPKRSHAFSTTGCAGLGSRARTSRDARASSLAGDPVEDGARVSSGRAGPRARERGDERRLRAQDDAVLERLSAHWPRASRRSW